MDDRYQELKEVFCIYLKKKTQKLVKKSSQAQKNRLATC